jgi:hypothetical protein
MTSSSRAAHPHRFTVPSRAELAERLREIIRNPAARAATAAWASEYIVFDAPQLYPPIEDPMVSATLQRLSAADAPSTDRPYLYGEQDFLAWLEELLGR